MSNLMTGKQVTVIVLACSMIQICVIIFIYLTGPPMNFPRKCHASGVTEDGFLYVTGGTDEQVAVLSTEVLDLK